MSDIIDKWCVLRNLNKYFVATINLVYIFGANGKQAIITTNDDNVYAFGDNCLNACLGLGHKNPITEPTIIHELCGIRVTQIEFGLNFAIARTNDGYLYSWGYNGNGELGLGNTASKLKPTIITTLSDKRVVDVKCGKYHSMALTASGEVFVWGVSDVVISVPFELNFVSINQEITAISCGKHHSLALSDTGDVYYWGKNKYGQCGNGTNVNAYADYWQQIEFINDIEIVKMVCGPHHSMVLSKHGSVYCFGRNDFGQLGDGSNVEKYLPRKVSINGTQFKDIAAVKYNNISVALSADGFCYVWGQSLGKHTFNKPIKIPYSDINEAIECYSKERLTYKPLEFSKTPKNVAIISMWDRISEKFDKPEYSDVMFKVENKKILAQKTHLINVCKHFETMFAQNWVESNTNEIEIKDYSYEVYYAFLKYLYTNSLDINAEQAINLIDLSNCYLEEELKQRCVQLIKSSISNENMIFIYSLASKYNSQELKNACTDYFVNNMKERSDAENILENAAKQITLIL